MRLVARLLDDARAGRSAVLAVVGEAGMGKSAILDAAADEARDLNVLRARGIQSEARIPFAALYELLRPALDHLDRLATPQREALEGALALRPARAQDRFAVGAATLGLLAAYCEDSPLLVLVDDAQWIDGSSADALLFAFRRLIADPIAVLLAVREGEPSLVDGADLPTHHLAGLDRADTAELVGRLHGTEAPLGESVIERLHRGTGGNPLALVELANDAASTSVGHVFDTPIATITSVGRVYLERCEDLPGAAREVLVLVAASDTGELPMLARAAALAGLDIADLGAAETVGLVALTGDGVEFRHPLVRSAVYAAAPADRRRAMHRALAGALPDAQADRRAWHLALAALGPDDAASSALEQAGQRARARSAYDVASQAFERAGSLTFDDGRRCALLLAAADAAWLGGRPPRAVALLDGARRDAPTVRDVAAVDHQRGLIAARLGPVGEGLQILLDGAELVVDLDPEEAVVMLAEAVNASFYAGNPTAMLAAASRIHALVGPDTGRRVAFFAAMAQGMALIFGGHGDTRGADLVREAVALVEGSDELADDLRLLAWAAMGTLWLRESEADRTLIDRAMDVARRRSAVGVLPFLLSHLAVDGMASDRWTEAETAFHEAIELARETGQRTDLGFALARLAWLEARQGKELACRSHADEARALAAELDLGLSEIWSIAALADLDLGMGRLDAAVELFEAEVDALRSRQVGDVDLSPEPELVELHLRLGHREQADAHQASFEREAVAKGQPWALARAARGRGLLAPADEIDRHFGDALAWHDETPDVFEAARTRLLYGARLRRARHRLRAREHFRDALATFDRLGAAPWYDIAVAELAATGETARRRDPSTRRDLTPRELQIALLLADGSTTREAAAMLFLSPKTVEFHLRSVYRKLGINSREELAAQIQD